MVAVFFVAAKAFTNAHFMADTGGYVVSILAYNRVAEYVVENPNVANFLAENSFWDFGHLLWRPLGLVLFKLFYPLTSHIVGSDPAHNVLFLLMAVNFVAGLLSVLLLYLLLEKLTSRRWIAVFVTVCFIFTNGLLNFMQTVSPNFARGWQCHRTAYGNRDSRACCLVRLDLSYISATTVYSSNDFYCAIR